MGEEKGLGEQPNINQYEVSNIERYCSLMKK